MLIGSDMKLNSPSSLVGQALTEILQHPERARDALRVLLHLVRERRHVCGVRCSCQAYRKLSPPEQYTAFCGMTFPSILESMGTRDSGFIALSAELLNA